MGIFDEIKSSMSVSERNRFREILIAADGARRFFDRWRVLSEKYLEDIARLLTEKSHFQEEIAELQKQLEEAQSASMVMGYDLGRIDEFVRANFPDVHEVEKTEIITEINHVTLTHGSVAANGPVSLVEMVMYLLGELLKIRRAYGGLGKDQIGMRSPLEFSE